MRTAHVLAIVLVAKEDHLILHECGGDRYLSSALEDPAHGRFIDLIGNRLFGLSESGAEQALC
jgi:hypothetical protein